MIDRAVFTTAGVIAALALMLLGMAMLAHHLLNRWRLAPGKPNGGSPGHGGPAGTDR